MDIYRRAERTKLEPLLPPLFPTKPAHVSAPVDDDKAAHVRGVIQNLVKLLEEPRTHSEALGRLKALPVGYFLNLQFDMAATAAKNLYKKKLVTPEEVLDVLIAAIVKNVASMQRKEAQQGLGTPGRLTLGGTALPGIKVEHLRKGDAFTGLIVKENLQGAIREGNSCFAKIFPHLLDKKE